ncbi:hypothetical protein NO2_0979 [Candidatus Termititenax persephonae]|uniref:Uncharacterized protein n=1 Tax=Candidatus Termititenax persephonae TaxID=2218525 RepID=A0A388TH28_9BACT|nr:hypothetical protein NO2_0979 [Candidatus Termititenax persephonae]
MLIYTRFFLKYTPSPVGWGYFLACKEIQARSYPFPAWLAALRALVAHWDFLRGWLPLSVGGTSTRRAFHALVGLT